MKYVYDQMNKVLLQTFEKFFINKASKHLHDTRGKSLDVLQVKTTTYGSNPFSSHEIDTYNFFQNKLSITKSLPDAAPLNS